MFLRQPPNTHQQPTRNRCWQQVCIGENQDDSARRLQKIGLELAKTGLNRITQPTLKSVTEQAAYSCLGTDGFDIVTPQVNWEPVAGPKPRDQLPYYVLLANTSRAKNRDRFF